MDLRRLFMHARMYNHMFAFLRIKTAVGESIHVIPKVGYDAWEYEYEQHFWELGGKLVDIRDTSIEILAVQSGGTNCLTTYPIK